MPPMTPLQAAAAAQRAAIAAAAAAQQQRDEAAAAAAPASSSKGGKASGSKRKSPAREQAAGGSDSSAPVSKKHRAPGGVGSTVPSSKKSKQHAALDAPDPPLTGTFRQHGPAGISTKLRRLKHAVGAANIPMAPPPPLGTFINISQSLPAMQQELSLFPFAASTLAAHSTATPASSAAAATPVPLVPSSASWFSLESIHDAERRAFPDLLSPDAHPRLSMRYRDTRNFIVRHYRSSPRTYLSLTAVQRLVMGDAQILQRLHSFLEGWGIINFHVDPGSAPMATAPGNPNSAYPLLVRGALEQLASSTPTHAAAAAANAAKEGLPADASLAALQQLIDEHSGSPSKTSLTQRRGVLHGPSNAQQMEPLMEEYTARRDPTVLLTCASCASTSVESVRYVCRQRRSYFLCSPCFFSGRYSSILSSADFERFVSDDEAMNAEATSLGEWSRAEILRLLQAIAMHEDRDWEAVAEFVKTRGKEECALKFIQMPIEEPFLEQLYNPLQPLPGQPTATGVAGDLMTVTGADSDTSTAAAAAASHSSSQHAASAPLGLHPSSVPFRDSPNPLLSHVSFLTTYVSPSVGAAAAQAVLTYVSVRDMDGMPVQTPFGPGKIIVPAPTQSTAAAHAFTHGSFNRPDGIVTVQLPWGRLYAHASTLSVEKDAHKAVDAAKARAAAAKVEPIWVRELVPLTHHILQAAARKARELAEEEERKVLRYVAQITGALMKRVEAKLTHLEELDAWTDGQKAAFDNGATQNIVARASALAEAAHLPPVPSLTAPPPAPQPPPPPPVPMGPPRPQVF